MSPLGTATLRADRDASMNALSTTFYQLLADNLPVRPDEDRR